ncbi:hypothetical protein CWC18_20385 [Pseudoalteromonas aurantia]|uniref:Uncharacterized protein n=1 Tax=Pseudoalteromonas aurantia TaxID=43654 RepID=A0A5S3V679_9GAMM|nr:hypothetical protein CWC18_20385 [Pseudoalteromonas aurantia]TMO67026.1 hypothetical protein CWC19_14945 [Pseudoalteromonas aurantia]
MKYQSEKATMNFYLLGGQYRELRKGIVESNQCLNQQVKLNLDVGILIKQCEINCKLQLCKEKL